MAESEIHKKYCDLYEFLGELYDSSMVSCNEKADKEISQTNCANTFIMPNRRPDLTIVLHEQYKNFGVPIICDEIYRVYVRIL